LIYGSGAVGSYLGIQLAQANFPVTFLTRERNLPILHRQGFTLFGVGNPRSLPNPVVTSDPHEPFQVAPPDLVLLTVKAYDVASAAQTLAPLLPPTSAVVSFLNGVNNEATLSEYLGERSVIPATLTTAVQMLNPSEVQVTRRRGIGLAGDHPVITDLLSDLHKADFRAAMYPDPKRMKWSKLLTNIVSNATSAILDWTPRQVFEDPVVASLEIEALREAVHVMRHLGFAPQDLPGVRVSILGRAIFLPTLFTRGLLGRIVGGGRGDKKPSFHFDIGRGRSEIEWLNGAVVKYGEQLGIPTPVNKHLTNTFLQILANPQHHREFLNQPQRLLSGLADRSP
jgi:2-dehydropantoate 2-reductase